MDFAVRVVETEKLVGQRGDGVLLVVDADEVGDEGVEKGGPALVPDARGAVRDALHVDARREVQGEEQGV